MAPEASSAVTALLPLQARKARGNGQDCPARWPHPVRLLASCSLVSSCCLAVSSPCLPAMLARSP